MATKRQGAGCQREKVAFDPPLKVNDGAGGTDTSWDEVNNVIRLAQVIYRRGSEGEQAGKLQGTGTYKIRIRQSESARLITTDWRMRLPRTGAVYQLREVDNLSDRAWIWIVAETGVAV